MAARSALVSNGFSKTAALATGSAWPPCAVATTMGNPGNFAASRRIASPSTPPGRRRSTTAANGRTPSRSVSTTEWAVTAANPRPRSASVKLSASATSSSTRATIPLRRARPRCSRRRGTGTGLGSTAMSPSRRAASSSLSAVYAVTTSAGSSGSARRMRCTSSAPFISGMRMSETSASKRSLCTRASAFSPESTTTASAPPASAMISARFSAKATLSSTMRYLRMRGSNRQADDEARAVTFTRRVGDVAAVARDGATHERQPEADALRLGGDERLEQTAARVGIDPGPRILDGDLDHLAVDARLDAHLARWSCGVHGVVDEVHEHLAHLGGVDVDVRQRVDARQHHARRRRQRTEHAGEGVVEHDLLAHQRPVADHVEQRRDDAVGDAQLLADAADVLLGALITADARLEDIERRLDDAERVAQLVADGADELPEGREPLGARLLRDQIFAIGVQHDRELEIEDLADGGVHLVQARLITEILVVDDLLELATHHVHRAEHVMLRQRDAHVHAPDAAACLKVLVVPRPGEQPVHPGDERDLELADARLAADERGARAFVREDAR